MDRWVLDFEEFDGTQAALVGGKGAHLGELSRIEGIRAPDGFCVTTDAFRRIVASAPSISSCIESKRNFSPSAIDTKIATWVFDG